jgi:predicted transcriptional regulator of viral defense system
MTFKQALNLLSQHFANTGNFTTREAAAVLNCTVNLASARMICLMKRGFAYRICPGVFTLRLPDAAEEDDEIDSQETNEPKWILDEEHQAWMEGVIAAREARLKIGQWQQRH